MLVSLKVLDRGEPGPAFPNLGNGQAVEIKVTHAAILEDGTAQGKSSLALMGLDTDGCVVMMQLTENMSDAIFGAWRGAKLRWSDRDKAAGGN